MDDCGLMGMIREVYPVSFIMIVLSLLTFGVIALIKRPYIKILEREIERRQKGDA